MKNIFFQEVATGLSIYIDGKQTFVPKTHNNFDQILKSLREKAFAKIEDLINGVVSYATTTKPINPATLWPFPTRADSTNTSTAPKKKNYPHKNYRVYVFDNGSWRGVVYLKNKNELHDRNGTFICTTDNASVQIRAARTASVEKLLLRIPKADRQKFYIEETKVVPVLKATIDSDTDGVVRRVKKIISQQLGIPADQIKPEHKIVLDLGADSLDEIELVMALEDEFEAECPDEDAEKQQTVQHIIDYVRSRLSH